MLCAPWPQPQLLEPGPPSCSQGQAHTGAHACAALCGHCVLPLIRCSHVAAPLTPCAAALQLLLVAQELGGEEGEDAEQVLLGYFIPMDSRRLPAADCTQPAVHAAVCERRRLRRRQQVQQQQQQKPQEAQVVHDQQLTCTPQEPHCVLVPPGCELQQLRAIQQQQQQQHTAWLPALDSCCQAADAELTRGGEVTRAAQGAGNRQRHGGVEEEEPNAADEQGELQEACARVKAAVLDRVRALSRSHRRVLSQMPGWWLAWQVNMYVCVFAHALMRKCVCVCMHSCASLCVCIVKCLFECAHIHACAGVRASMLVQACVIAVACACHLCVTREERKHAV